MNEIQQSIFDVFEIFVAILSILLLARACHILFLANRPQ